MFEFVQGTLLDGMWFWDLEHRERIWMSDAFWGALGYDPASMERSVAAFEAVCEPADFARVLQSIERHLADPGFHYDETVRCTDVDGATRWIRCRGFAIRDGAGRPLRLLGAHSDVTSIKRDEERLRAFVAALPGVALVLDDEGRYVEIMATKETLLAGTRDELLGRRVQDVVPEETATAVLDAVARVIATGRPEVVEYRMHTLGGTSWFEGRVTPFRPGSERERPNVLWLAYDITERKRVQFTLEQRNEELRRFAYVAAHDLRSPLQGIQQLSAWLQEDVAEGNHGASAEHARLIESRVQRLQRLLGGLLEYARTAETLQLEPVDTAEVVAEVLEFVRPLRDEVRIEVDCAFPRLRTDRTLLHQVLQNLLANAVTHHHRGGGTVWLSCEDRPESAVFQVSDDGPGIPAEYRERIFEVFQTLRSRDEVDTSGIGLAIVKKAVAALDGAVTVADREGGGTVFRVELPR